MKENIWDFDHVNYRPDERSDRDPCVREWPNRQLMKRRFPQTLLRCKKIPNTFSSLKLLQFFKNNPRFRRAKNLARFKKIPSFCERKTKNIFLVKLFSKETKNV